MTRRKRIIRDVADKRRQARDCFWPWTNREYFVDNPVNSKSSENMPKEVERDMFWSIIFLICSPEPEAYKKERKCYWFTIRKYRNECMKPGCIDDKSRAYELECLSIEYLEGREDSHICIDYSL